MRATDILPALRLILITYFPKGNWYLENKQIKGVFTSTLETITQAM